MAIDVSDAPEQRSGELIPDGTFVKCTLHLRPGGYNMPAADPIDTNLFTASKSSDAIMLDGEYTVLAGEYQNRKWFENMVVAGGTVDEKGVSKGWNMTKTRIRAMLDSAQGLDPKDTSDATKMKRVIRGFKDLDGIPFYAKLTVEPGGDRPGGGKYFDKNVIDRVVVFGDAEYADLVAGKPVAAKPRNSSGAAKPSGASPAVAAAPAWGQGATTPTVTAAPVAAPSTASASAAPATSRSDGPAWLNG